MTSPDLEHRLRQRIDTLTDQRDQARGDARELRRRLTRTMDYLSRTRRARDLAKKRLRDRRVA